MVLAALGHTFTEAEIRSRCGHTKVGMRLSQIGAGLADLPIAVEYHMDWSLDDLSDALRGSSYPIVGIDLRPIEGLFAFHAVVLVEITSDSLLVHDSRYEQGPRTMGLTAFKAAWESAEREAVVITAPSSKE
jgi:ABC-type bacteriocin/lantibiotic exporter with double-glycine peptidase domain